MKHALILAHPDPESFAASVAQAYQEAVQALGHEVVVRDLYALDFDPRLKSDERPDVVGGAPRADVVAERAALADADVFVLVYPIWFGTPPAMMKGYIERVFGHGFAFDSFENGLMRPLLSGRRLISFSSSGSSQAWLEETGLWSSLRRQFDYYLGKVFGLQIVDHVHFPSITQRTEARWIVENLNKVKTVARAAFAGAA